MTTPSREINVACLFDETHPSNFQSSRFESGLDNIGEVTWRNAVEFAEKYPPLMAAQLDYAREYFRASGGWNDEEVAAMSDTHLQALFIQFAAAALLDVTKEALDVEGWIEAFEQVREDTTANVYPDDSGEAIWFYLGE